VNTTPAVLVTGGAGFVGSYVVRDLLATGAEVVILDNAVSSNAIDSVLDQESRERVSIELGDVTDTWRLVRLCERHQVDRIVHLASPLTTAIRESPAAGLSAMCIGTANVFEVARALRIRRVVWASSMAVFGRLSPGRIANDAPRRPESLYGSGKVLCEDIARAYRVDGGVDSIGLRLTVLYGPWRLRGWGPSFGQDSDPIRDAVLGQRIAVQDPGLRLDWLYVEDAASLVCRALAAPTPEDHVFNTSGEPATRGKFAESIAELVPGSAVTIDEEQAAERADDEPAFLDDSPLRDQIGYETHHTIREGIAATVAAYKRSLTGDESNV
jgi:nucleoside-diphosphate-sugar epimerase